MTRPEYMSAVLAGLGGADWPNKWTRYGGLASDYAFQCYMTDVPVKKCVETIKIKLPEEEIQDGN